MNNLIDYKTIEALKRGDRYMMFRILVKIERNQDHKIRIIQRMLHEIPEIDIQDIEFRGTETILRELIDTSLFSNKYDQCKMKIWN